MFDVAIVGAGISGLICAQQLRQAGYRVVLMEKSRGLGGRVTTRRLQDTCADRGLSYLTPNGELTTRFVELLKSQDIVTVWTDTRHEFKADFGLKTVKGEPLYIAPNGMSAIARFLAKDLEVQLSRRVVGLNLFNDCWHLQFESSNTEVIAKAVVMAIPAPQALVLIESFAAPRVLDSLRKVEFSACISAIARYPTNTPLPSWRSLTVLDDDTLAWIGNDSSKRLGNTLPIFVFHSSAKFAQTYIDTEDLQPVGQLLLAKAAKLFPELANFDWLQCDRWRYAFPTVSLADHCLDARTPQPLFFCGDWCGGINLESAMRSGLAAAEQINQVLQPTLS
ncbi:NAD(P)/FAD-dependent oxidoreductase [Synechocystis sp. PCC 7509]|uniref:NAD(P)/FAD-dependent oxidoreductase n=1 Tax=Synechocystis sp. PCC 7509 TaxID=927677 RepID=UPI0002ABA0B4|nr:FAD-dependent oxidoreductase [Synechocystis sp. PCC 7509]